MTCRSSPVALVTLFMLCAHILIQRFTQDNDRVKIRLEGPMEADDPEVLNFLREYYLREPSALPYGLATDGVYNRFKHSGNWDFIHDVIKDLFKNERGKFFIEAGALDGEHLSNTLWLEQELGWSGLLIEPDTENYKRLLTKNRKTWTSNTCLSTKPFPKQLVFVSVVKRKTSPLMNDVGSMRGMSHLLDVKLDTNIYDDWNKVTEDMYSMVQCFPFVSYIKALNISTVDFLSLDIQGAEKAVLKYIPWEIVNIRVILVEIVHHETFDHGFVNEMNSLGYRLHAYAGEDLIFVKVNEQLQDRP